VLLGLHSLHSHGIVHGDLHMGNILLAIEPLKTTSTMTERLYQQGTGSALERLDGRTEDIWAPKYILAPEPLFDFLSFKLDPLAKIGDLGSGRMVSVLRTS
jgi:serine/threonine protein kinase